MDNFYEPVIVVSKCLGLDLCRYDGQMINNNFIKRLDAYAKIIPVCPEVEIGLGVPRPKIKLVQTDKKVKVVQRETNQNLQEQLKNFSQNFLQKKVNEVDGFILKSHSPSCGMKDCKIYNNPEDIKPAGRESGIFAKEAQKFFPEVIKINEIKLKKRKYKRQFLTHIFIRAHFRALTEKQQLSSLIKFHSENKFLLQAHNEKLMRQMGSLTANPNHLNLREIFNNYEKLLNRNLNSQATRKSHINVLSHCFGFISDNLTAEDKKKFESVLSQYRTQKTGLNKVKKILYNWLKKYGSSYIINQTYFNPFPSQLLNSDND
ncbi:MAG: YbgA family protein [Bacillota bacterium]